MKKRLFLCTLICVLLTLVLVACNGDDPVAPDPTPTPDDPGSGNGTPSPNMTFNVDFADGSTSFLFLNAGTPGTDPTSKMEIVTLDGSPALRLSNQYGGQVRLGVDVQALLGDRAGDVRTVVFDVYAEYPDERFRAVSGRFFALNNELLTVTEASWQIYLATRNPIDATFTLDDSAAAELDILEFAWMVNGPADSGETPAVLYIKSMVFYDAANLGIRANTSSLWSGPEDYGKAPEIFLWDLPLPASGEISGSWHTWGTDDDAGYLPWEIANASFGMRFEIPTIDDSIALALSGSWNGWGWDQDDNMARFWSNGVLSFLWSDIGFDPKVISEDQSLRIIIASWDGEWAVDSASLEVDGDVYKQFAD